MANNTVFPEKFIEELKQKNDIVSVISRYVTLDKKGKTHWGRCPFHNEKTPSFAVNEYEQFYHCFGCKASGDVIRFVEQLESVDFMGAVYILAEWAHMEVPELKSENKSDIDERKRKKDRLLLLMKDTARYFYDNLQRPEAASGLAYLTKREITPQLARRFGIGCSINFNEIITFLEKKGYSKTEMLDAGVIKINDKGEYYDTLGGRLIFPIINIYGEVVAFGGRTLKDKVDFAKYLNTADTILFNKKSSLYAINLLKKEKQNKPIEYIIIVEGYMDTISLHKAGFTTTIASMGTALTAGQAKIIKRFCSDVYICYDGDTAGKKATLRGLDILKEEKLNVKVVSLPEGMDPDDVIKKMGRGAYKKLLDEALPLVEFKLSYLKKQYNLSSIDGKSKYIEDALKVLLDLSSDVEKEVYLDYIQKETGTNRDFLRRQMENLGTSEDAVKSSGSEAKIKEIEIKYEEDDLPVIVKKSENFILASILHEKDFVKLTTGLKETFVSPGAKEILSFLITAKQKENFNSNALYEKFGEKYNALVGELINYQFSEKGSGENLFTDCSWNLTKYNLELKLAALSKELDNEADNERRRMIITEISEITKKIKSKKVD